MTRFATAIARDGALDSALDRAIGQAKAALDGAPISLAIVFASRSYEGIATIADALRARLPGVRFIGGTSTSCVFDMRPGGEHERAYERRGVSVSLVAGEDLVATTRAVHATSGDMLEVVAAAREIRAEAREHEGLGRPELTCLAFAPSHYTGDTLVAALKKGATTHAQLAGALLSSDSEDSGLVWCDVGGVSASGAAVAGLFSAKPLGVAARHGWRVLGSPHRVTRAEGSRLITLDARPAIDVWLEEVRAQGATIPEGNLAVYLASTYELAILGTEGRAGGEPIVRGPRQVHTDGSVDLFGSVPEGAQVQLVTATEEDLYEAARACARSALANMQTCGAAREALSAAAGASAGAIHTAARAAGALGLMCVGRSHMLGERYPNEPRIVAETLGVPFGGTTVHGEIALGRRDANGFYNSTAVVVLFPE